ncbi:MAG: HPP family protein [Pseudomonadales bacterium]|nr:HPP family protein [Pseudomonadales bacterium]
MTQEQIKEFALILGIEPNTTSHLEKLLSALGGGLGVAFVYLSAQELHSQLSSILLIASIGATAVLVFAIPHGPLSQPWPVIGGHLVSAVMGVTCYKVLGPPLIAASAAVMLAIAAMYYLRCLHPPGGATALMAVLGGDYIHAQGYRFVLDPVLSNVIVICATAVLFNGLIKWRNYPGHGITKKQRLTSHQRARQTGELTQEDFLAALQQRNAFVDITAEDLCDIVKRAQAHAQSSKPGPTPESLCPGQHYSNGIFGSEWSVRQIIAINQKELHYKTVAGHNKTQTGKCSLNVFSIWARYPVDYQQQRWIRIEPQN